MRTRRQDRGLEVKKVIDHLKVTRTYWSAVENNHTVLSQAKLDQIVELFELDESEATNLRDLRAEVKHGGWWMNHPILPDEMVEQYGLEAGATEIRLFHGAVVDGLLQTEEYAAATIGDDGVSVSRDQVAELVEIRMKRQERLTDPKDPLRLTALHSEAVLVQEFGIEGLLKRQLQNLLEIQDDYENVEIRILPFAPGSAPILISPFLLIDFDDRYRMPTVACHDALTAAEVVESTAEVQSLQVRYERSLNMSLSPEDSRTLIERRLHDLTTSP